MQSGFTSADRTAYPFCFIHRRTTIYKIISTVCERLQYALAQKKQREQSGEREAEAAVEEAVASCRPQDMLRVILTGETGEGGVNAAALEEALSDRFYALEVRDHTRMAEDIWARAGEDSLRGLFLRQLRTRWDSAATEEERETVTQAARFGLAALDHRDLG